MNGCSKRNLTRLLFNMSSLSDLSEEIISAGDLRRSMRSVLHMLLGTVSSASGAILRFDEQRQNLVPLAMKGLDCQRPRAIALPKSVHGYLAVAGRYIDMRDIPRSVRPYLGQDHLGLAGYKARYLFPLIVKDALVGAIVFGDKLSGKDYSADEIGIMLIMANGVALGLHNHSMFSTLKEKLKEIQKLYGALRNIYHDTVKAFAVAIDTKDDFTKEHSVRVAKYAMAIAREMNFSERDIEGVYIAGLLHDIGKVSIDKSILNKRKPLTAREKSEIHRHPALGADIVSEVRFPWKDVTDIIRHHHERPDKKGYPDRLSQKQLNTAVRIISLVDAFDAMTNDRPYRKRLTLVNTLQEICDLLGRQFDPEIAATLFKILKREVTTEIKEDAAILPHLQAAFDPKIVLQILEALIEKISLMRLTPSKEKNVYSENRAEAPPERGIKGHRRRTVSERT